MKRLLVGLAAGVLLATAGAAIAARGADQPKAIPLAVGQAVSYAGLTCTTYAGDTAATANLVCVRSNLKGYGVVISQRAVLIARQLAGGKVKVVFKARNG
jgi:hypothetical protein